jgi:NAD dependent epimerase/dehydratase family enzyme
LNIASPLSTHQTHQNYLFANTAGSASGFQWYVNDYGGTNGKLVLLTKSGSGGTAHIMTSDNSFAFNQWNHVAFTFDGSANEVKMYINGNLEVTGTPSAGFDRARELFIGAMGNGANWNTWPGEIDDVRLFNQLLSDTEISSLFGASSYSLIVNSGSGDGDYEAGAILNILADAAPSGQEFDQWTGDVSVIADVSAASTTLTMPASVVSITATYQDIPTVTYALAVNSGSGGGDYEAETVVNISADTPPTGQEFDQWTGDVSGIADVNSASTALTMPAAAASVSATYKDITYSLTVNSGTGDGNYTAGTVVNIVADAAPSGQEFDAWTGDVSGIADVNSSITALTMPASATSVSATYKDLGVAADHHWLFNNNGNDEIGSLDATLIGNATYSSSSSYEGAASLDLSNGVAKATIGTVSLPNQFSVSLWARNAGNQTHQNYLFANTSGGTSGFQWYVNDYGGTNGKLVMLTQNSSGSPVYIRTSDNSFAFNQWNHVALTFDGSANEVKMYINGILEVTGTPKAGFDRARELFIGAMGNGGNWNTWPGEIDDVRLFNYLLSDTEISSVFGSSSAGSTVESRSNFNTVNAKPDVKLFPNPSQDGRFQLAFTGLESEAAVLITGMSGNQIAQYHVNTEVVSFDTPLGSGLYFVTVKSEKINKVLKLVVQ